MLDIVQRSWYGKCGQKEWGLRKTARRGYFLFFKTFGHVLEPTSVGELFFSGAKEAGVLTSLLTFPYF